MGESRTIKCTINEDGTIEIDQIGWSGKECGKDVESFIKALGKEVQNTKKPEYYKENKVSVKQKW